MFWKALWSLPRKQSLPRNSVLPCGFVDSSTEVVCDEDAGHWGTEHSGITAEGRRVWWANICGEENLELKAFCDDFLEHEGWHQGKDEHGKIRYWPYI